MNDTTTTEEENTGPTPEELQAGALDIINDALIEADPDSDAAKAVEAEREQKKADDDNSDDTAQPNASEEPGTEKAGGDDAAGETDDKAAGADDDKKGGDAGGSADDKAKAGKTSDEEEAGAATDDDKKKTEPDPVNDPIDDEVKGRTRERMESLISTVKDTNEKLESAESDLDEITRLIDQTGTNPEQYGRTMQFLTAYNSTEPEYKKAALQWARSIVEELEGELGEVRAGENVIDRYDDLKQKVERGQLSEDDAKEIATGRIKKAADEAAATRASENETRTAEQQKQAVDAGKRDLTTTGRALRTADPERYQANAKKAMDLLNAEVRDLDPSKWAERFTEIYKGIEHSPTTSTKPTDDKQRMSSDKAKQQPLGGQQPAGGAAPEPGSMAEAIDAGIAAAGGK